jgi:uncharacterized protein YqeY
MEIKKQLEKDLLEAMRANDVIRRNSIRMVITAIKLAEVEKGAALDDVGVLAIIQKEIKQRNETIDEARKAERNDIIETTKSEIAILEQYLPEQLSQQELSKIISDAIAALGVVDIKGIGLVMKEALPKIQGRATNDQVSRMVRELLSKA